MKFYFCEACGVRVTDADLGDGLARDKKLKGVYCSQCAVGVTTMESLPLSDGEAREVLNAETDQTEVAERSQRPKRKTSASAIPPGTRRGSARPPSRRGSSPVSTESKAVLKVVVPAIAAAIVLVGLLFALSGGRDAGHQKKRSRKVRDRDKAVAALSTDASGTEVGSANVNDAASTNGPGEPKIGVHAPPPDSGGDSDSVPTQTAPTPERKGGPAKDTKVVRTEPTEVRSGSHHLRKAKVKFRSLHKAFDQAAYKGDWAAAGKAVEQANVDPALKPVAAEVASLARLRKELQAAAEARQRKIDALTDGRKRTFRTANGSLTGVVRKVEGEVLRVIVKGQINNQVIEYEKPVNLADLTPACRARLLGEREPATPDEGVAGAIREIAKGDFDGAQKALAIAGAHPLAAHYRNQVKGLQLKGTEAAAWHFWGDRISPFIEAVPSTRQGAKAGLKELEAFRADHGKTAFAASVAKQMNGLQAALIALADVGLIACWTFDDKEGNTARDNAGQGHHGKLMGGTRWTRGRFDGALQLDGKNGFVQIEDVFHRPNLTCYAWIKPAASFPGGWRGIAYTTHTNSAGGWWLGYCANAGGLGAGLGNHGFSPKIHTHKKLPAESWSLVGLVLNSALKKGTVYLNGEAVGAFNFQNLRPGKPLQIGQGHLGGGQFWCGLIDEVRIHERAIGAREMARLWESGRREGPRPAPLPLTPETFRVEDRDGKEVRLTWQHDEASATGFEIERRVETAAEREGQPTAGWERIATLDKQSRSHSDTSIDAGCRYAYRLRAIRGEMKSAFSPVRRVDVREDPRLAAEKRFHAFLLAFLNHLRDGDAARASGLLSQAEKEPALAPVKDLLEPCRRALSWFALRKQALLKGTRAVKSRPDFVLIMADGSKREVGPNSDFQIGEVSESRFMLTGKGIEMPMKFERLSPRTQAELIDLGLGTDTQDQLCRAFSLAVAIGSPDAGPTVKSGREAIEAARAAGAAKADLAYLERVLALRERELQDRTWADIGALVEKRKWKQAQAALKTFVAALPGSPGEAHYKPLVAALGNRIEKAIERLEGHYFLFKEEEVLTRFRKLFSVEDPVKARMEHKDGKLVFSFEDRGGYTLSAPGQKLGTHWKMVYRVHLHPAMEDVRGHGSRSLKLVFAKEGPIRKSQNIVFALAYDHVNFKTLYCCFSPSAGAWYAPNGMRERLPEILGMKNYGFIGAGMYMKGNAKKPFSAQGNYTVSLEMRDTHFRAICNEVTVMDGVLSQKVYDQIRDSDLALTVSGAQGATVELKEFFFSQLQPGAPGSKKTKVPKPRTSKPSGSR